MRGPKTRQIAAIDAGLDRALDAGVLSNGTLYPCDDRALLELLALVVGYQAGVIGGKQPVRTKHNAVRRLTQQEIVALAGAVITHRRAMFAKSWADKDALP